MAYQSLPSDLSAESCPDPGAIQYPFAATYFHPLHSCTEFIKTKILNHNSQFYVLVTKPFLRWLGTVAFTAFILGTLHEYARKDHFPTDLKGSFNSITTALILGLGLNLFVSRKSAPSEQWFTLSQEGIKELAKIFRWRLWAIEGHTLQDAELILGIESLLVVCKLAFKSLPKWRKRKWLLCFCIIWLLLNFAAQVATAIIGFTYQIDDGTSYNDTYSTNGMVLTSNLTDYFNINMPLSNELNQAMAHSWGEGSQYGGLCEPYNSVADISNSKSNPPYFCRRTLGQQEFAYRFKEYNPTDVGKTYPYFTERIITVSSGTCIQYNVLDAQSPPTTSNCIGYPGWNYSFFNSTYNSSLCIPFSSAGWSATIYIYNGTQPPGLDEDSSCGNRCKWIWAYRAWGPDLNDSPAIFQCPITVSEVSNTKMDAQQIPDSVARTAAASIALQGRWTGTEEDKNWIQYQFNAFGTPWEVHGQEDERAGANMAEFALRSLATMVEENPVISLPGTVPQLGSHVTIIKKFCLGLLGGIVAGHLLLFIVIALCTKSVVKTDDSYMDIAKLLSERFGAERQGNFLLRGNTTVCKAIAEERDKTTRSQNQGRMGKGTKL